VLRPAPGPELRSDRDCFASRPADAPFLGVGVGLRPTHYASILDSADPGSLGIDFFEAISENFMAPGGRPPRVLDAVRSRFPIVLHGVSLNVGSSDPIDASYLDALESLALRHEPAWLSDHLCWTGVGGRNHHDLLPLPSTEAIVDYVAARVIRIQDRLKRRIALENVLSYLAYCMDEMPEWSFLTEIARRADCGILLDVNNVYVSAHNHGFDATDYLDAIPPERVFQIHLAGHREQGPLLIDTHDHPVRDEVWALYERTVRRLGPVSTLIEWDDRIPSLEALAAEAARARAILSRLASETLSKRKQEVPDDPRRSCDARHDPAPAHASHHRA
jgi:uncharacterized protein (UPF0276 family)